VWRLALALAAMLTASCGERVELHVPSEGVPAVRVLLFDNLDTAEVAIDGPYELRVWGPGEPPRVLTAGERLATQPVGHYEIDVIVGELLRKPCTVAFVPEGVPVEVNGHRYRGSLEVSLNPATGKLRGINVVDVEGYLRGVLPHEMYADWPAAALRAQAVAARTYARVKRAERTDAAFHLYASTADQMYGGYDAETAATNAAVQATAGRELRYRGRPFTAYYHSCCGGTTADAGQVFGTAAPRPLRGSPCGYCTAAPRHKWSFELSREELAGKLRIPDLIGLSLEGVSLDGRVGQVTLHLADGSRQAMAGTEFRRRIGTWKTLRGARGMFSTRFKVRVEGQTFQFRGQGHGHGVGLCQWGARGMAEAGMSATDILERYYPGADTKKVY
jgi:stage II sporulation protein D